MGKMALLTGELRSASVVADTEMELWSILLCRYCVEGTDIFTGNIKRPFALWGFIVTIRSLLFLKIHLLYIILYCTLILYKN